MNVRLGLTNFRGETNFINWAKQQMLDPLSIREKEIKHKI